MVSPALLVLLPSSLLAADLHKPGVTIDNAAAIDITENGFNAIEGLLPAMVPSGIDIPDQGASGSDWYGSYSYSLTNGVVGIKVSSADIAPTSGLLAATIDFLINVNTESDPFYISYSYEDPFGWTSWGDTCNTHVEPFPAQAYVAMELNVDDSVSPPVMDVVIRDMQVSYDLSGEDILMEGCSIGDVEEVLGWFGLSLFDWILGYASEYIDSTLSDMTTEIEGTIEDAFSQATIDQQVDLMGATLTIHLEPQDVVIDPAGVRILMKGSMDAPASTCVDAWDPGGSTKTETDPPTMGVAPSGITEGFHVAASLSDDIINQALYAVWRSGLLCYTLEGEIQGFELSTSLLSMMGTDAFEEIFPEPKPLTIVTRPRNVPAADLDSANDVGLVVQDLGVDMYGEVDGRQALVLGLDLDANVGADLNLDAATGNLDIALDLSAENIVATVRSNELAASATSDIESGFGGLLDTILGMLGGSLSGFSTALPSYEGIGLTDIQVGAAGGSGDWLGVFAWVGSVTYPSTGCDESGGTSCDTGCGVPGSNPARWGLLPAALAFLALRRRRQ